MPKHRRKILILNQSYWPDIVATAQHAHDLAKDLAARDNLVTVVASRSLYGQSGSSLPKRENADGVEIHRVAKNLFRDKSSLVRRTIDYVLFNLACLVKVALLPRHDVVICMTTPPFISLVGVILKRFRGSKLVLWEMDLYPDFPVAAGVLRRGSICHRLFDRLDRFCLAQADRIVALGRCMKDRLLAKGADPSRMETIHPWSDPNEVMGQSFKDRPTGPNPFRDEWGLGDRFVIQYSGNCGVGHDVQTLFPALLAMRERDDIRWVFVGDGMARPAIERFVSTNGIRNVLFKPYQKRERLGDLLTLGDAHLVLMSPGFEGVILPSKLYGILAAARPAIFIGPSASEVARVIDEQRCGFVVANGDHGSLQSALERLIADPTERSKFGERARQALESAYSMQNACEAWNTCIESVLAPEGAPPATGAAAVGESSEDKNAREQRPQRMRILVISQYFPPDVTAAAYRIGDTCQLLKAWGHDVHVITTTPHKGGQDDAKLSLLPSEITRIEVSPLEKRTASAYIEQYLGFVMRAFLAALRLRRSFDYDVVWATSPPLFMAMCTIPLRLISRRPVVLDIRDLWPESAVNIGKVRRGSLMERFGKALEWMAYRWSDRITCVSVPMRDYISQRTKRPITVVYNGAPRSQLAVPGGSKPNPDIFCYAGNLGYAQGLDGMFQAFAKACQSPAFPDARLRIVGTGAVEGELRSLAGELGIADRVEFLGVKPKLEALSLMSESGTLLIPLLDSPAFALTVPSKVFDYMGLGRPVIASIRGEGKHILDSTGANVVVPPGDVDALADAFVRVRRDWESLFARSPANIELISERFSRETAVEQLQDCLVEAVRPHGRMS